MIVVWAGTSDLVSEPIGAYLLLSTTTALMRLVLAAYPGMDWDGIERTRSAIGSVFGGWGNKLASSQAYPRPVSCLSRPAAAGSPHLSSTSPGLRPELYEAETRPTYG